MKHENIMSCNDPKMPYVLSCKRYDQQNIDDFEDIQGYGWWVRGQVRRQPPELFSVLPDYDPKAPSTYPQSSKSFAELWKSVSRYMKAEEHISIDNITACLCEDGILHVTNEEETRFTAQNLIFAIIGWQTLLYQPDMRSCPPSQLAIVNEMGLHQGHGRMCLKQDMSTCRKSLHEFLLGFGILLPPRNLSLLESCEDASRFRELKSASAASLNAHLLTKIGGINIEWVDSLSCHLEFDIHLRKLFLFRFPLFCTRHIPPNEESEAHYSAIHACAAPSHGNKQWATTNDVTQLLKETILSYRLLFGQNKKARRLYRKLNPFRNLPDEGIDEVLDSLCGRKRFRASWGVCERENYDLPYDFPILRYRLATLIHYLSERKPRTWKELWHDKRDSASWLTFWAVLCFGVMGLLLALLQVIFQMIQVFQH